MFSVSLVKQERETKRKRTGVLSLDLERGGRTTESSVDATFERSTTKTQGSQCSLQSVYSAKSKAKLWILLASGRSQGTAQCQEAPATQQTQHQAHLRLQAPRGGRYQRVGFQAKPDFSYGLPPLLGVPGGLTTSSKAALSQGGYGVGKSRAYGTCTGPRATNV